MRAAHRVLTSLGFAVAVSLTVPAAAGAVTGPAPAATVASTTTLTSNVASSSYDSWVTFTAQVAAASGTPSGSVIFADASNGSLLAAEPLSSGKASFTTAALAPGRRQIVAYYAGDSAFSASTSGTLSMPVRAAGSDAVAYQIDSRHDGEQGRGALNASSLTRKWRVDLVAGYVSYPVIAGGRVFVTIGNGGGGTIRLYALNARNGRTEWTTVLGETASYATVTYDGQDIFGLTPDGTLAAYRASTGRKLWSVQLPQQSTFNAPPTAYDGVVYVSGAGVAGSLYAVSEATGRVWWMQPVLDGEDSSPAVDDTGAYVSYSEQQDFRYSLNGQLIWHYAPSGDGGGGSIPALHGGSMYARGYPYFDKPLILSAASGTVTGSFASDDEPAFAGASMFTVRHGNLAARPTSGGPAHWTFANRSLDTAPVVSHGVVYALSTSGYVFGVSAATGARVWRGSVGKRTNGPILSGLAVGGGLLVAPAGSVLTAFGG